MLGLAYQKTFWPFFGLMLLHCFFYVPTISMTNAIAFANIKDAQKDFGFIRVWGTFGWIAASLAADLHPDRLGERDSSGPGRELGFLVRQGARHPENGPCNGGGAGEHVHGRGDRVARSGGLLPDLAAYASSRGSGASFAPFKAFKLLAVPSIAVLFAVTFLDSLVHYSHFFWTGRYLGKLGLAENWISPAMSIGQAAELATMAILGLVLKRLGWRLTMIFGILGHVVRFGIYSIANDDLLWLVILSNVAHGFAYAFFFATVYIYVDENFPKDIRTSAQSLFNLLILGFGPLLSNFLSPRLGAYFKNADGSFNYNQLFLVPLGLGLLAALILALFFHPAAKDPVPEEVPVLVN